LQLEPIWLGKKRGKKTYKFQFSQAFHGELDGGLYAVSFLLFFSYLCVERELGKSLTFSRHERSVSDFLIFFSSIKDFIKVGKTYNGAHQNTNFPPLFGQTNSIRFMCVSHTHIL